MTHLPDLIRDLAFILFTAAVVALLFKKLKQPVVLGYLIAGFFLGPNFPFFLSVKDTQSIKIWAEMGVIFLLFGLGLEFSFKKLSHVGKSAGITAIFETTMMTLLGFTSAKVLGWSDIESVFLGCIIAISSTTIIVKAFDELNLKGKQFVHLVFGVLIVEDLVAILFMVLLTTFQVTKIFSGIELAEQTVKLIFFLTIWFLVGIYVIPQFLKKIRKELNDETTLLISLGMCLLMVVLATSVGFSAPLGAFIMGSILAETKEGKRIEQLSAPIQSLFSAVFFVSVGMMIDVNVVQENKWIIIFVTLLVIVGKITSVTIGALLSGQNLRNATYMGFSHAQIGEFSFIIATLGVSLNLISSKLYPVAVSVSAITTFTTPFLIKIAPRVYEFIEPRVPNKLSLLINRYQVATTTKSNLGFFSLIWKAYGLKIFLNATVVISITIFLREFILPMGLISFSDSLTFRLIASLTSIFIAAPFLWAVFFSNPSVKVFNQADEISKLSNLLFGITIIRIVLGTLLVAFIMSQFFQTYIAIVMSFFVVVFSSVLLRDVFARFYEDIEKKFFDNLNEKEREELAKKKTKPELAPWDAVLSEFVLSPNSSLVGKTLLASKLKEKFGITIALIERGDRRFIAPGRDFVLMSYDLLHLIGTEEELVKARAVIEEKDSTEVLPHDLHYGLLSMFLTEDSPYIKKSIRDCRLRENIDGLIVGLERDGKRYLSPDSSMVLEPQDILWVVGDVHKITRESKQ